MGRIWRRSSDSGADRSANHSASANRFRQTSYAATYAFLEANGSATDRMGGSVEGAFAGGGAAQRIEIHQCGAVNQPRLGGALVAERQVPAQEWMIARLMAVGGAGRLRSGCVRILNIPCAF